MRAAVQARQTADRAKTGPHDELKMYITTPLEHVENVVSWWGVSHFAYTSSGRTNFYNSSTLLSIQSPYGTSEPF
jgi:hypothetical protein